jgi:hypothetical protein
VAEHPNRAAGSHPPPQRCPIDLECARSLVCEFPTDGAGGRGREIEPDAVLRDLDRIGHHFHHGDVVRPRATAPVEAVVPAGEKRA